MQKFSDAPLTECPECRGHLRKVFSPVGVVFKGSGFYSTDSRTSGRSSLPAVKPDHAVDAKPAHNHGSDAGSHDGAASSSESTSGTGTSHTAPSAEGSIAA